MTDRTRVSKVAEPRTPAGGAAFGVTPSLADHSARGQRLADLRDLAACGPTAVAQRRRLRSLFGEGRAAGMDVAQRRVIPNVTALKNGIVQELNTGENAAGSAANLLSAKATNLTKLSDVYTPGAHGNVNAQGTLLNLSLNNGWRQQWYDQVDARVRAGAQATAGDALFWAQDIETILGAEEVTISSMELLGEELHDRGLGPTKVTFSVEHNHNPLVVFDRTYVIKPEDRSVERAVLGSGDSVATRLNRAARLGTGRQVNTLNIHTDPNHGTIMEYVTPTLKTLGESALRKVGFWDSTDVVSVETIGLALLTGLWDLHNQNVMFKGGAPALIDSDVAARPLELEQGPSQQAGFTPGQTQQVANQIGGDRSGASQILQYAIDHPMAVTNMIMQLIGNHRSRIVPAFTAILARALENYGFDMEAGQPMQALQRVQAAVNVVRAGDNQGSAGLIGELGPDQGGLWNGGAVRGRIVQDFDEGVIPHFQYQASNGQVFQHGVAIWQGRTIADAMNTMVQRLTNAQ